MEEHIRQLREVLQQVRRRWFWLQVLRVATRAASGVSFVTFATLGLWWAVRRSDDMLALLAGLAAAGILAALVWACWVIVPRPSDRRVARLIEEQCPQLEDRLATAVDVCARPTTPEQRALAELLGQDTIDRLKQIDYREAVSTRALRRARLRAALAAAVLFVAAIPGLAPARTAGEMLYARAFPGHVTIQVRPGDATVVSGQALRIVARIRGGRAAITPVLKAEVGQRGAPEASFARTAGRDEYVATVNRVTQSFRYRVTAGDASSATYGVTVLYPPRVVRIDLRYEYPAALGLPPRTEEDAGDIYAPAGTRVHLSIRSDKPIRSGMMTMSNGSRVPLRKADEAVLDTELTVAEDDSYRLALTDARGLQGQEDSEYFIRVLNDSPPGVRIVQPTGDRRVSAVEEVTVEAHADDDYGVEALDLVFSIKGGPETAVPFVRGPGRQVVDGRRTLYLEDLHVQPGDFITYYARARDSSRGARANEARSDMFFLDVRPFEEEFAVAESQASGAGGGNTRTIDDLIASQKDIIVATWKLDRRSLAAGIRAAVDDARAIARAQGELKARAQALAGGSGSDSGRATAPGRQAASGAGDPIAAAVDAMGRAERALDSIRTSDALSAEMEAYNALLRARAEVRRWQVARGEGRGSSGGGGSSGGASAASSAENQELGAMFDRELRRRQQTNYEMPASAQSNHEAGNDALDRVRDLARRQAELSQQQRDLADQQGQMKADDAGRQLERLTREQSELRRQVEELAQQMAASNGRQTGTANAGAPDRLRQASENMRGAISDLRRLDPASAGRGGNRALSGLRDLQRQLEQRPAADRDAETRRLADQLQRTRDQRQRLVDAERKFKEAARSAPAGQGDWAGQADWGAAPPGGGRAGDGPGKPGDPRAGDARAQAGETKAVGTSGSQSALDQARDAYMKELQRAAELASGLQQEFAGVGRTPEGQQMVLSAPGFHQDYTPWVQLRRDVTLALEQGETSLARKLQDQDARSWMHAGSDARVPDAYKSMVEQYYQAIAKKKQ